MFERNYVRFYDRFNSDKAYKPDIEFVYKWAKKPRSIFDIGCGSGSYWRFFPVDTDIVGIDKSREMAKLCRGLTHRFVISADVTKYKHKNEKFDCAISLFHVLNYIPTHNWWKNIPVKRGGYFIFDVWDKKKVDREGFSVTSKLSKGAFRMITPKNYDGKSVDLNIFFCDDVCQFNEIHKMYVYSHKEIESFCGKEFEIIQVKKTDRWSVWYKCQRK